MSSIVWSGSSCSTFGMRGCGLPLPVVHLIHTVDDMCFEQHALFLIMCVETHFIYFEGAMIRLLMRFYELRRS